MRWCESGTTCLTVIIMLNLMIPKFEKIIPKSTQLWIPLLSFLLRNFFTAWSFCLNFLMILVLVCRVKQTIYQFNFSGHHGHYSRCNTSTTTTTITHIYIYICVQKILYSRVSNSLKTKNSNNIRELLLNSIILFG